MQGDQIQTLVNDLGRKLAERPESVSLTEFLVLASTAVVKRQKALLAAGARAQTAHAPSPYTGISPAKGPPSGACGGGLRGIGRHPSPDDRPMPSDRTNSGNLPGSGHCPASTLRDQLLHLLQTPLSQLKPAGLAPGQLEGLRALPEANRLKLVYALNATEPITDPGPDARRRTVELTLEMLGSLARFVAGNPRRRVSLATFRFVAALTVIDLRCDHGLEPSNSALIFLTPTVLQLEGAVMLVVWRARSAGTSEQIVGWAADMVQELWELAARMRQWPEKTATELIRTQGGVRRPPREILRQVVLPHAAEELDERFTAWPRRSPQTESDRP